MTRFRAADFASAPAVPWRQVLLAALVGAGVFALSIVYIQRVRDLGFVPAFYQADYEPAVRLACGQPFGVDAGGGMSRDMAAFLKLERGTLSCDAVAPAAQPNENPPTRAWYHLFVTVAAVWKVTGISWAAVDGVAAALLGVSAAFLYGLLRLGMPAPVAVLLVLASIRPALPFLFYFRDLNKAPFLLGAVFAATLLVTRSLPKGAFLALMAAAGLWLGVGYGFRPDALIGLPLVAAAALFFRPRPVSGTWRLGLLGTLLLVAGFAVAASPILTAFRGPLGSCHWHFAVLGLSDAHSAALGLGPGTISWLPHNEDGVAWRTIAAYAERAPGLADVGFCTPEYDRAGRTLYLDIVATFPADFLARAAAAARQVIAYGIVGFPGLGHAGEAIAAHRDLVQGAVAAAWLAVVLALFARQPRVGLFALFAVSYLCAYPVVQFDARHYFHLAFLAWVPAGLAAAALARSIERRRTARADAVLPLSSWVRAAGLASALAAAAFAIHAIARESQASSESALLARYGNAPGQAAPFDATSAAGRTRLAFTQPAPVVKGTAARMLRLDFGGPACAQRSFTATIALGDRGPAPAFRREIPVALEPGAGRLTVFAPLHFAPGRLDTAWLELPAGGRACLAGARWLDPAALPVLWVGATIRGNV